MNVYIVTEDIAPTYKLDQVIAKVFSTKEKAENYIENQPIQKRRYYGIQEWEVDE